MARSDPPEIRVVSLFAGIEGIGLGLERAGGFKIVRQVEIDPFCLKVLDKHYPGVPKGEDVRKEVPEDYERMYGAVGLVCGGFPCQDLSVAGKRQGLAGERSGLFFELLRIADAVPTAWVLAENVPGLLSSAGGGGLRHSPRSAVRRLTPTECERLQGFPDGWTLLDNKTADSPRYRALGNAVCVNVAEWIGKRIAQVIRKEASA